MAVAAMLAVVAGLDGGVLALEPAATPEDVSLFLHAVAEGDQESIDKYLARGLVNAASPDGETPLHVAGIRGSTQVRRRRREAE